MLVQRRERCTHVIQKFCVFWVGLRFKAAQVEYSTTKKAWTIFTMKISACLIVSFFKIYSFWGWVGRSVLNQSNLLSFLFLQDP